MVTRLRGVWEDLRRIFYRDGPDTFMKDSVTNKRIHSG